MPTDMRPFDRGDLCVVTPTVPDTGIAAVCLVVDPAVVVDGRRLTAVVLTSAEPELATGHDVVLAQGVAGVPWPVVVQADLRAVVDPARVGVPVGRVPTSVLAAANRLLTDDRSTTDDDGLVRVGFRLGGPCDRRWDHKVSEGRRLDAVAEPVLW